MKNYFSTKFIFTLSMFFLSIVFALLVADNTYATIITIDLDQSPIITLVPKGTEGDFAKSGNSTVSVTTDYSSGYKLGIMASSSTNLVNNNDSTKVITSISSATSEADFKAAGNGEIYNNKWGYLPSKINSAANTSFLPSPNTTTVDIIDVTNTANLVANTYSLAIGARVNMDTTVGGYSNTFVVFAIVNNGCNPFATSIGQAVCMQDMNDNVISSMVTHTQYRLTDLRDQKDYYVTKMNDGRVWMTQNLDFDVITDTSSQDYIELTSENTDLNLFGSQSYTSSNGYKCYDRTGNDITDTTINNCTNAGDKIQWIPARATLANDQNSGWVSTYYLPYSWDGGDYYNYTSGTGSRDNIFTMEQCTAAGHTEAECTHYHVGNYYNWASAVASNDTGDYTERYTVMSNSICPAGWRLPGGRNSDTSTDIGYYAEAHFTWQSENIISSFNPSGTNWKKIGGVHGLDRIRVAPIYFVRAGYRGDAYSVANSGYEGSYYTNSVAGNQSSFMIRIYYGYSSEGDEYSNTLLYGSIDQARSMGVSIRCVARQNNTGHTTITFDKNANDAVGVMDTQRVDASSRNVLDSNTYSRTNYVFNGWNTQADGNGVHYDDAGIYYSATGVDEKSVTLYAEWAVNVDISTAEGVYYINVKEVGGSSVICYASSSATCKLRPGVSYEIIASLNSGYSFDTWSLTGAGTLSDITDYNPLVFVPGNNSAALVPSTTPNNYDITVNFEGGVSSVTFTNATYGTQTVSASGGIASLTYNQRYDITVVLNNYNFFVSWERVSGRGTIGSTTTMNTYFTPSYGTAVLKIKAANTQIKVATGTLSATISTTGGDQVCTTTDTIIGAYCNLTVGVPYNITVTLRQGYSFSAWNNTGNGTFASSTSITTTFTAAQSSSIDVITPSAVGNPYTVTVIFGNANVSSVTIDGTTFTSSGGTKTLIAGTPYTISGVTDLNTVAFTSSANGEVVGDTFVLYGDATLTATGLAKIYMQSMGGSICTATPMEVYDSRGGEQVYTVARLGDGKCWMLQNLVLPGNTALSADDTDVTSIYINGFTATTGYLRKSGNTLVLPASANKSVSGNNLSDSSQFSNSANAYVFNSSVTSNCGAYGQNTPCYSYYSWFAATLGGRQADGSTAETRNGFNAAASICPKGWRLPYATTDNADVRTSSNWKSGDTYALATAYGSDLENSYSQSPSVFYNNAGYGTTPNFLLVGYYNYGNFFSGGSVGDYWLATAYNSSQAYYFYFTSSYIGLGNRTSRNNGYPVRCVLRE